MAKYYGRIGFVTTTETSPGVWKEVPVEKYYYGELIRNSRRWQDADKLNDDLNISNEITILMDEYAIRNFHSIRYIEFMGNFWKVSNVQVEHPRLRLSIGGVYNRKVPPNTSQ